MPEKKDCDEQIADAVLSNNAVNDNNEGRRPDRRSELCIRLKEKLKIRNDGSVIPDSGVMPEAMAKAIARGSATTPTVRLAERSLVKVEKE